MLSGNDCSYCSGTRSYTVTASQQHSRTRSRVAIGGCVSQRPLATPTHHSIHGNCIQALYSHSLSAKNDTNPSIVPHSFDTIHTHAPINSSPSIFQCAHLSALPATLISALSTLTHAFKQFNVYMSQHSEQVAGSQPEAEYIHNVLVKNINKLGLDISSRLDFPL